MRVLQIGNFSPPHSTENHLREAMLALDHTAVMLQEDDIGAWESAAELVKARPLDRLPEVVIWTRTKSLTEKVPIDTRLALVKALHDRGIPLFGVHLDRWWGLKREKDVMSGDPYFSPFMTILFTADGGHDDMWASIGVNHKWMPPAVSHVEANRQGVWREELCSPITFVGSWQDYHDEWPQRMRLIEHLRTNYPRMVKFWPEVGKHGIRGQELCDVYESSCIVVGDSCLVPRRDGKPITSYVSDRVPETIGRGGFLLHPRVPGVTDVLFVEDAHLACYGSMNELDEKIHQYLHDDESRLRIAVDGQAHVRANHTYLNRMKEVLGHA